MRSTPEGVEGCCTTPDRISTKSTTGISDTRRTGYGSALSAEMLLTENRSADEALFETKRTKRRNWGGWKGKEWWCGSDEKKFCSVVVAGLFFSFSLSANNIIDKAVQSAVNQEQTVKVIFLSFYHFASFFLPSLSQQELFSCQSTVSVSEKLIKSSKLRLQYITKKIKIKYSTTFPRKPVSNIFIFY